jgi:hypothetical protein
LIGKKKGRKPKPLEEKMKIRDAEIDTWEAEKKSKADRKNAAKLEAQLQKLTRNVE